ncbi:MAG: MFS transporter [Terriglobales bacterium]
MSKPFPANSLSLDSIKGTAFVHLDFVLTGIVMTLLGPMLPVLSANWSLTDTQAGYFFIAQWVTSIGGMLLSGVLVQRRGYRTTLIVGLGLMAAGIAGLVQSHWTFGLLAVALYGAGTGVTTPAANLLIAEANPNNRAAALNLLNSSWGIGAMGCPFLVAAVQRSGRTSYFLYGVAAAILALGFSLAFVRFTADDALRAVTHFSGPRKPIWTHQLLPVITALFFIYVGTETSIGGWVASYAQRVDPVARTQWAITPSFFWGALLAGRVLAPLALRHVREIKLATAGVASAALGVAILLVAKTITLVMIGASVAGLGLASVFPINVSLLSHWFGETATRLSGVIFSIGNLGGAMMPWLVGFLSTHFGSLRAGFLVPLFGSTAMLAFYLSHDAMKTHAN